ncbi:Uncharacterized protein APZ42_033719 [Daphnia magna]|uniref:Uncharacterized protein n=1 Tax=Daphnia magna TaxID=35525 RepID=A0A0P4YN28_9CRUS|nr:Uncharacterized protein APZ42_033719 [Daphnia magna]
MPSKVSVHTKDVLIKLVSFSLTSYMQIRYIVLFGCLIQESTMGILLQVSLTGLG